MIMYKNSFRPLDPVRNASVNAHKYFVLGSPLVANILIRWHRKCYSIAW